MGGQYADFIDGFIEDGFIELGGVRPLERIECPELTGVSDWREQVRVARQVLDPAFARHYPDFED